MFAWPSTDALVLVVERMFKSDVVASTRSPILKPKAAFRDKNAKSRTKIAKSDLLVISHPCLGKKDVVQGVALFENVVKFRHSGLPSRFLDFESMRLLWTQSGEKSIGQNRNF